jgi:hypothetical protein
MLLRNLVVSVKPKITDKWDYFDVKAALPENPAELEKVFGSQDEIGCKMTTGPSLRLVVEGRPSTSSRRSDCSTSFCPRWRAASCLAASMY